jgi:uncharacterized protein (TIGR00730 family)
MQRICVFCGSYKGTKESYVKAAEAMGKVLVSSGIDVVYGGGDVGLMGILADSVVAAGGKITGVIPEKLLAKEIAHQNLTDLKVVKSMHERKALMAELSDAFIALPGGFGTLEEFCEVVTWSLLGFHRKPCGLLNVDGYYDHLIAFFDNALEYQFLKKEHRDIVLVSNDSHDLLDQLKNYKYTVPEKWITKAEF